MPHNIYQMTSTPFPFYTSFSKTTFSLFSQPNTPNHAQFHKNLTNFHLLTTNNINKIILLKNINKLIKTLHGISENYSKIQG